MLRGQHALQLIAGAVLGIGAGAGVKAVAGSASGRCGAVAIAVAVVAALIVALAVGGGFSGRGVLFVNRATTSAILMIAVAGAATGSERLSAALIGGGVTLVITVIMFPAAPLPLIQDAVQQVFAALRDTLAHLAGLAGWARRLARTGPSPLALTTGQRIPGQLARLQEAQSAAGQVASLAPRRWPGRSRVRRAGEQAARLHLVGATVLSLAQAASRGPAAALSSRVRRSRRA